MLRSAALLCCAAALLVAEPARPLLHPLFGDAAVLQRGKPVNVWGWAAPGATVTVELSGSGQEPATATAGADGRWQTTIGPFVAGGPHVLRVGAGAVKIESKEVLVGEVWLCGGQSNMEMRVRQSGGFATEKAGATLPGIRQLKVGNRMSGSPQALCAGTWTVCSPESVGEFTAAGYFMAQRLHAVLGVPIGLVNSTWGGTSVETWTSREALAAFPDLARQCDAARPRILAAEAERAAGRTVAQVEDAWYGANDPGSQAIPAWSDPAAADGDWAETTLPAMFEAVKAVPADWDGSVWVRRMVDLPTAAAGRPATLRLGKVDDQDTAFVNGQAVGRSYRPWERRAHRIPAQVLRAGANLIAVRVLDTSGQGGFSGAPEDFALVIEGGPAIPLAGPWRVRKGFALKSASPQPWNLQRDMAPACLFDGMIAPLLPLTHAGTIWYQGENNVGRAAQYRELLPAMIADWRTRFGQGELPFLIVSLANFQARKSLPSESGWAELREAQALTARTVPRCGLAVAIDIGEAADIHPKNKQDVGARLALAAEAVAYGKPVEWSGPWYTALKTEGASIRLAFDHLGGGLAIARGGSELKGFAIAGADKVFTWAQARIDGDTVVVSSPAVAAPVAVRYAWADNPECTLANRAGLPAVPFRTDAPASAAGH